MLQRFSLIDACPTTSTENCIVIVRFLMKLFNTNNMDIINNCRQYFDVKLPSSLWSDRVRRFEKKFAEFDNIFCKIQSQFDSLYLSLS